MDKKAALKQRSARSKTTDVALDEDFVVTVRALTRDEVKQCTYEDLNESKITSTKDIDKYIEKVDQKRATNRMIAMALVDPADMTEEDVADWLADAPGGDSVKVMAAIQHLSGMDDNYPKSGLQKNGSKSRH